ncbi:MAG TPA: hypothetical protein VN604_04150 [Nitrospirota bacterium]|nr:hypothetical protein [Nitrospirota bacterium]
MSLQNIAEVLKNEGKFLLFQPVNIDIERTGNWYLAFGVVAAWLAGIGRYWDNPRAQLWQTLGLGSVVYIFILALILWLLLWPLRPNNWSYKRVLIFIGMTAPLGILYAVPVEKFFTLKTAQLINVWFLAVVSVWRVTLLFLYLKRKSGLNALAVTISTFLPLVLIVSSLAFLNLEHVIFRIMAGLAEDERSANDAAYMVLVVITFLSFYVSPVLLLSYSWLVWFRRKQRKAMASS